MKFQTTVTLYATHWFVHSIFIWLLCNTHLTATKTDIGAIKFHLAVNSFKLSSSINHCAEVMLYFTPTNANWHFSFGQTCPECCRWIMDVTYMHSWSPTHNEMLMHRNSGGSVESECVPVSRCEYYFYMTRLWWRITLCLQKPPK